MESTPSQFELDEVLAHAGWVRALAQQLLADEHRAEDAAQETMRVALERRPHTGPGVKSWLGRVLRHVAFNQKRGDVRRIQREQRVAGAGESGAAGSSRDPERDLLAWSEQMRAIVAAVEGLEEPFRQVIKLRYFEELTPAEIAKQLQTPAATVRTRLKRGLDRLRVQLRATWGDDRYLGCLLSVLPRTIAAPGPEAAWPASTKHGILKLAASVAAVSALFVWQPWATGDLDDALVLSGESLIDPESDSEAALVMGDAWRNRELVVQTPPQAQGAAADWRINVINGATNEPVGGAVIYLMPPRTAGHPAWKSIEAVSQSSFAFAAEQYAERLTADEQGTLRLDSSIEPGRYLFAKSTGLWGAARLDSKHMQNGAVQITLFADYNLEVTVVNVSGDAVPGVSIGLAIGDLTQIERARTKLTLQTDARGVAEFQHLGEFVRHVASSGVLAVPRIRVQAPFQEILIPGVELRPGKLTESRIVLAEYGRVEVEVRNQQGEPAADGLLVQLQLPRDQASMRSEGTAIMQGEFVPEEWRGLVSARVQGGIAVFEHVGIGCRLEVGAVFGRRESVWAHIFDGPTQAGEVIRTSIQQDPWKLPVQARLLDEEGKAWQGQTRGIFLLEDERNDLRQIPLENFELDLEGWMRTWAPQLQAGDGISGRVWIWSEGEGWARHWVSDLITIVPGDQLDLGELRLDTLPVIAGEFAPVDGLDEIEIAFDLRAIPRFPTADDDLELSAVDKFLKSRVYARGRAGHPFQIYFPHEFLESAMHLGAHATDQKLGLKTTSMQVSPGDRDLSIQLTREAQVRGRLLLDAGFAERIALSREVASFAPDGQLLGAAETASAPDEGGWFQCTQAAPASELVILDRASEMIIHRVPIPKLEEGQALELPLIDLRGSLFERRLAVNGPDGLPVSVFYLARLARVGIRKTAGMPAVSMSNPGTFLTSLPDVELVIAAPNCRARKFTISDPESKVQLESGPSLRFLAPPEIPDLPEGGSLEMGLFWNEAEVEGLEVGAGRIPVHAQLGEVTQLPGFGRWRATLHLRIQRAGLRTSASIGTTEFVLEEHEGIREVHLNFDPDALARVESPRMDEPAIEITRRHDLDALRGFAMVLGIGLHASLSFFEMFWPVQDTVQSPAFAWFFFATHGFRMQLFFLISGYFTMMLFQKRGLRALVLHRVKRIALPLAIGMFTIVPFVEWSASWAVERGIASWMEEQANGPAAIERREELIEAGLVAAARAGDLPAVESLLEAGATPELRDEKAITGLHWAAFGGHTEVMRALVAAGVDVNIGDGSDGSPLHWAAFFCRPESVEVLLELGADPERLNGTKETPADTVRSAYGDETIGVLNFIGMLIGAKIDLERAEAARPQVRALLGVEAGAGSQMAPKLPAETDSVNDGQVFHHLWFLWFLIQLVALFAVCAGLGARIPALARVGEFVRSPLGLGSLVALTLVPQLQMGAALPIPSFGPDTDSSWLVAPHLLGYYALFFFFGVGSYRVDGSGLRYRGFSMLALPLAFFGLLPIAMQIIFEPELAAEWLGADRMRGAEVAIETLYPWLVSFGMIGLFRVVLSRRSAAVRYLSDASYWMYLIHLPLIFIAQAWIRDVDASVWLKFIAVTGGVSAVSSISYAILVRPTPIGTLLNGRRKRSSG